MPPPLSCLITCIYFSFLTVIMKLEDESDSVLQTEFECFFLLKDRFWGPVLLYLSWRSCSGAPFQLQDPSEFSFTFGRSHVQSQAHLVMRTLRVLSKRPTRRKKCIKTTVSLHLLLHLPRPTRLHHMAPIKFRCLPLDVRLRVVGILHAPRYSLEGHREWNPPVTPCVIPAHY